MTIFTGSTVAITATFTDQDGALTQMDSVSLVLLYPDDTSTTISGGSISYDSSSKTYSYNHTTTQAGRHVYRWTGTDSQSRAVVQEGYFLITGVSA